jgi:hypothetical protein
VLSKNVQVALIAQKLTFAIPLALAVYVITPIIIVRQARLVNPITNALLTNVKKTLNVQAKLNTAIVSTNVLQKNVQYTQTVKKL